MDRYIDNNETQKYGPDLRANVKRRFGDDARPAVRTLVTWLLTGQAKVDASMAEALAAHRQASGASTTTSESSSPVLASAHRTLRAFYKHLDAKIEDEEWTGTLSSIFPGLLSGVKKNLRPLKVSYEGALKALNNDTSVPEHASWTKKLTAAHKALSEAYDSSHDAVGGARDALSEQGEEKAAWLRQYHGVSLIVEGLLTLEGAEGELASLIPHLSAPGTRKATDGKAPNVPTKPASDPIDGETK